MKTYDFEEIEKIIWNNDKLEKALDKILIEYEDNVFNKWAYNEIQEQDLTDEEKKKKYDEVKDTAFDFCDHPMWYAKEYCENAVYDIYDNGYDNDDEEEFTEDELVDNLIVYCVGCLMQDMFKEWKERV